MNITKAPTPPLREDKFVIIVDCFDVVNQRINSVEFGAYDPVMEQVEFETELFQLSIVLEAYLRNIQSCVRCISEILGKYMHLPNADNKVLQFFESRYYAPRSVRVEYHTNGKRDNIWYELSEIELESRNHFYDYLTESTIQ